MTFKRVSVCDMQAQWANEDLPTDLISVENAAIVTSSSRWPLLIDPQLQESCCISIKIKIQN